jgi:hypothetical protein
MHKIFHPGKLSFDLAVAFMEHQPPMTEMRQNFSTSETP